MNDELSGTYALVHPDLTDDPARRQGQVGLITYADPTNDDFYVSFEKGQQGLYSSDALLVLNKSNDIYWDAFHHTKELSTDDFKNMLQISLLLQSGLRKDVKTAIDLAAANPVIRGRSMTVLKDQLGLASGQTRENQPTGAIGR